MSKSKNKRRAAGALTQIERAYMSAFNYKGARNQEVYHEFIMSVKSDYRSAASELDFGGKPSETIQETEKNAKHLAELKKEANEQSYLIAMRMLVLGYWFKNKRIYRMTPEAVEFLESRYPIERLDVPISAVLQRVAMEPVYIEFCGEKKGLSCFSSLVGLKNPKYCPPSWGVDWLLAFSFIVQENNCNIQVTRVNTKMSVADYYGQQHDFMHEPEDYGLCIKTLIYLGWLLMMKDAGEEVLRPRYTRSNLQYDILPIPYENSLPDFTKSGGWIASGLCNYFGYLSRDNMVRDFRRELEGVEHDRNAPIATVQGEGVNFNAEIADSFVKSIALEWEKNKVVYQYSRQTGEQLVEKYRDEYSLTGITDDLLDFAPYPTMVMSNIDTGLMSVVSRCNVTNSDGRVVPAFLFISSWGGIRQCLIQRTGGPYEVLVISDSPNLKGEQAVNLYAFYHLLSVMKQKTIKRMAKELIQLAPAEQTALIPFEVYEPGKPAPDKKLCSDHLVSGYFIEDIPLTLFDITPRTVKLVPRQKAQERIGWRMRPHTRRAHPHRYWVGRGAERHQVTRMLAPMEINRKDKTEMLTTVHELR